MSLGLNELIKNGFRRFTPDCLYLLWYLSWSWNTGTLWIICWQQDPLQLAEKCCLCCSSLEPWAFRTLTTIASRPTRVLDSTLSSAMQIDLLMLWGQSFYVMNSCACDCACQSWYTCMPTLVRCYSNWTMLKKTIAMLLKPWKARIYMWRIIQITCNFEMQLRIFVLISNTLCE